MRTTFLIHPVDIHLVCYRLEIGFWRMTIDLLSDSRLLQKLVARCGRLTWQLGPLLHALDRRRAVRWAAAGLGLGFFTALVSVLLNH
jgi:hypothetical protein